MSILDFEKVHVRKPTPSNRTSPGLSETQNQTILEKLISEPVVDSSVLKHVYHFIHSSNDTPQSLSQFLEKWRTLCFLKKKPSLDEFVNRFYDKVDGEVFEKFINRQEDNYTAAQEMLQTSIENQHQEYVASGNLRITALEKYMSLQIASEVMPMNFFPIFNYACSENCTHADLKSELLSSIYDLHLIGYSPSTDVKFLSL